MAPPSKYNKDYHDDWAWSLASKGATDEEIAKAMRISVRTFHRWKKEYVQPAGDDVEVTAEGRRAYKKLTVYCDSELRIDDQQKGTKADLILVDGVWYTCTSCQKWRNTILAHWQASFSAVPETEMQR